MKSRTSSFNLTVFRKDLTRFAPAWAVYIIALLLVLTAAVSDGEVYYRINNMEGFVIVMAWINLFYAPLVAQLVFGDLYNSRLCNALHAMPVTRQNWFVTHSAAGLAFSVVPNLVVSLLAIPALNLGAGWTAIPLWLLASCLQYLFFFGAAVLCVMLSGNRLGQIALYGILQFAGLIVYWLASRIYEPLLYGIQINGERFYPLSPAAEISQLDEVFAMDYERILNDMGEFSHYEVYSVTAGDGWGYMAICAAVGVLALAGALVLYRRRKLECAGDFVAFKAMEPVVLMLVTVCVAGLFHLFGDIFGLGIQYVLLGAGMIVGFFGCKMLLERTTRVFQKKTFLACGALLVVFAASLGLTWLDPLGLTRYQPDVEDVESVTVSDSYSILLHDDNQVTVTEQADIETMLAVHAACIDRSATNEEWRHADAAEVSIHLEYKLKNGKSVHRVYYVMPDSEAGQALKPYFSTPECVLGYAEAELSGMAQHILSLYSDGKESNIYDLEGLDMQGLLDAIAADCKAGNMAQINAFHGYSIFDEDFDPYISSVEIGWDREGMGEPVGTNTYGAVRYTYVRVYRSCVNTLLWLEENGLLTEEMKQDLGEKYGDEYITFN